MDRVSSGSSIPIHNISIRASKLDTLVENAEQLMNSPRVSETNQMAYQLVIDAAKAVRETVTQLGASEFSNVDLHGKLGDAIEKLREGIQSRDGDSSLIRMVIDNKVVPQAKQTADQVFVQTSGIDIPIASTSQTR